MKRVHSAANDPGRFSLYRESLATTLARTGAIAIGVALIATFARLHRLPASSPEWYRWFTAVVLVGWFSFGGHWVELSYLNKIRPRIANWSDASLAFVRIGTWIIGGMLLSGCAALSYGLMTAGELPGQWQFFRSVLLGGPVFVAVEMVVHLFLLLAGISSFWNLRG